jgi:methylmalonyl-CoA mutase cobalamin-binding domain/chain
MEQNCDSCEPKSVPHVSTTSILSPSARAMRGTLDILKPLMQGKIDSYIGRIVIGTVKGDLHDIGKNLVASMFEGCGFEVINLGVDVSSDKFISAALENKADIICMSALLTTTMNYMKEVIDALETSGLRGKVKVMVGGAPVSDAFARSIGADAYTSNANAAVIMAKKLINAC